MTLVIVGTVGFAILLIISALEDVSLVQTWRDIQAGKALYTAPANTATQALQTQQQTQQTQQPPIVYQ